MALNEQPDNELSLKIQALADNELPADEIPALLEAIEGSHEYRNEYARLLRLKRQLADQSLVTVPEEWLEKAERRIGRRIGRTLGLFFFLGSYIGLVGYAIYTMVSAPDVPLAALVLVLAFVGGAAFLLANAIVDRIRESKTDKYRGVVR